MLYSDTDTFRFLTHERSSRLRQEADAERLARKVHETAQATPGLRSRLPLAAGLARSSRRRSV
jgi:hypothetical protein